jgi:UDP-glucose 4-epimerase
MTAKHAEPGDVANASAEEPSESVRQHAAGNTDEFGHNAVGAAAERPRPNSSAVVAEERGESSGLASRERGRMTRTPRRGRAIAVSGASTFLGRRLVALLAESDYVSRIVVVDTTNPDTASPKTSFYAIDLTQPGVDARLAEVFQAEQIDTFVHLALLETPIPATAWAHEFERVGTMQVLHACHKQEIRKLVVVSTALVYGAHSDNPNYLREESRLRGMHNSPFVADKLDVEAQVEKWRKDHPECAVSVLRMAMMLGPNIDNYVKRYFSRTFVPTVLGYDPLVQFVHEQDALAALRAALESRVGGVFNIASEGVLRLSTAIRASGRLSLPLPYVVLRRLAAWAWLAQLCEAPAPFVALLRHLCVIDMSRAQRELDFRPHFTGLEAVLESCASAVGVRDAKLLSEAR